MKSIEISDQIRWDIGSSFRNSWRSPRYTLLLPYSVQFSTNVRISLDMPGQKNWRAAIAYKASLPGWTYVVESWISCKIRVLILDVDSIYIRSRNVSFPEGEIPHFVMETFSHNVGRNRISFFSIVSRIWQYLESFRTASGYSRINVGMEPVRSYGSLNLGVFSRPGWENRSYSP
jgi:hypothetical protein